MKIANLNQDMQEVNRDGHSYHMKQPNPNHKKSIKNQQPKQRKFWQRIRRNEQMEPLLCHHNVSQTIITIMSYIFNIPYIPD